MPGPGGRDEIGCRTTGNVNEYFGWCVSITVRPTRSSWRRRPACTGYAAVEERLDYRVLAEVLAMELGKTVQTRGERAERAGGRWAARMMAARGEDDDHGDTIEADTDDALDRAAGRASQVFTRMGFAPELADAAGGERVIKLHACPVRELARAHPEVGCGLHRGVLRGLVDNRAHDPAMSARLEPFVEPELCLARVVAE
jgi:predicted ArsR family transcriptional regulator